MFKTLLQSISNAFFPKTKDSYCLFKSISRKPCQVGTYTLIISSQELNDFTESDILVKRSLRKKIAGSGVSYFPFRLAVAVAAALVGS